MDIKCVIKLGKRKKKSHSFKKQIFQPLWETKLRTKHMYLSSSFCSVIGLNEGHSDNALAQKTVNVASHSACKTKECSSCCSPYCPLYGQCHHDNTQICHPYHQNYLFVNPSTQTVQYYLNVIRFFTQFKQHDS